MIRVGERVADIHMGSELKQRKIGHSDEVDGEIRKTHIYIIVLP